MKEPDPVPYSGIKHILSDGYKVLDFPQMEDSSTKNRISTDLILRGIDISEVFDSYNEYNPSWRFVAERLTEKRIEVGGTSNARIAVQIYKKALNFIARLKYECSVIPEVIDPVPRFWALYTLNSRQAMWTKWEDRAIELDWGIKGKATLDRDDKIEGRRVELILGILGGMGITLALVCLVTEKFISIQVGGALVSP